MANQTAGGLILFYVSIIRSMSHCIKRNLASQVCFIFCLVQTCSVCDSEDCSWQDQNNLMAQKLSGL